ncbi:DUF3499 domain-containing protein [Tessaracoccus sp. OH4464_COT-324]|uniref:DUF3499 domain-containing protein n=1 Tax=Tessaracoccus sp. OH4464_COT-324 TaxID=2491059 RepID=UPI00210138CB|nr:DUF3499 domain-containing protein [Tessaracoccus sp. OH4464_COT-324]
MRKCSRTACLAPAVATMTFAYADSTAVLGPLATDREPGAYDLCARHAESISVPMGWEMIRLSPDGTNPTERVGDDLMALADAVRQIGLRHDDPPPPVVAEPLVPEPVVPGAPHLRIIRN